jgi:hypothetical protein
MNYGLEEARQGMLTAGLTELIAKGNVIEKIITSISTP